MEHPFMTLNQIPKTLPRSTLACPPSKGYIEQFTLSGTQHLKSSKTSGDFKDSFKDIRKDNASLERGQCKLIFI